MRGCKDSNKRQTIVEDCYLNDIQILGFQETHMDSNGIEKYTSKEKTYILYHCGEAGNKYHGVGIIVEENLKPTFKQINARICLCTI